MIEELEDIKMYDEVKALNEPTMPFGRYVKNRNVNHV